MEIINTSKTHLNQSKEGMLKNLWICTDLTPSLALKVLSAV